MTYAVLLIAYILLLGWATYLPVRQRGEDVPAAGPPPDLSLEQQAYLSGGTSRLVETAVTRLFAAGALVANGRRFDAVAGHQGQTALEADILSGDGRSWAQLRNLADGHGIAMAGELIRAGLLHGPDEARAAKLHRAAPHFALAAVGLVLLMSGLAGRPHGPWEGLIFATVGIGAVLWSTTELRTSRGRAALEATRERCARLRLAATRQEAPQAVALFGTAVLAGSSLELLHARKNDSGSGCGGGGTCGGDSGGCGGGGCGGGCGG